ncbi:MAG: electron transfer flavoprotein subunit alpha/FixB family protein [Longimicrobiales bacterium]
MADNNVLAVLEQRSGSLRRVSHELITAARQVADAIGGEPHALVIGAPGDAEAAARSAGRFGARMVRVAEHDALSEYHPEGYARVVTDVVGDAGYFAVLIAGTSAGRDLAPRVAVRLDAPLATDATELSIEDGDLLVRRPMYSGKAFATVVLNAAPRLITLRPNVFTPQEAPAEPQLESVAVRVDPSSWKIRVRETRQAEGGAVDVAEASIIVSGGRGMQGPEKWAVLETLRDALGPTAALGASRAVVDAGWRPHAEQVGQTGKTVAPQLYFAIGISGAIQHLAGMRTARTIVAINKDPDAPIFKLADYGIVGDAFEVVPRLSEEIRRLKE